MNISEMPDCAERQLLLDDICLLAHKFSELFTSLISVFGLTL